MKISIGLSPCPNDTFIFDALINKKIDTEGIDFAESLEDVETLNRHAIESIYDVTKISYAVYPEVRKDYIILNSGSAIGTGVGPLLIAKDYDQDIHVESNDVAIPGINTTAHFLFSYTYPNALKKVFLRYDQIESFVLEGKGLGVIIHENRFTYQSRGLNKIIDLGEFWEKKNNVPIPLGGIVIKRGIDNEIQQKIDRLIKKSIEFAYSNYPELNDFIRSHAKEMSEDVMRQHIDLYVNNYSLSLGEIGKMAVMKMMDFLASKNESMLFSELFVS